jgi:hypothetical protein
MSIDRIMTNIQKANWIWTDDFKFFFFNRQIPLAGFEFYGDDIWDMCTINIDTAQLSSSPTDVVLAGKHRYWVPLQGTISITATFRDYEGMKLKEYFTKIWYAQQKEYFDDIKSTVKIFGAWDNILFESDHILIDSVSQTQFDNNNTQIAEFSVVFSTGVYSTAEVQGIGSKG